ncbi:hypothetical protein C0V80_04800 [Leuconostoc pseudomesenteroides]|uniref:hypothetical protein n=1 Tax=Leuconostoc pseudomesenteroides TaxID=33968 RepID=UPI001E58AA42|nr:hypothetical protein [Leuconostoc pseudomesenteroides]MCC7668912.1 hypothetical protein [Leuconostoc pseudomesenteroides]
MIKTEIMAKHPNWVVAGYADLDTTVNCANCGRALKYGDGYTSRQHFTDNGAFGLCECGTCYFAQLKKELATG